jgi:hypothetical protein
MRAGNDGRIVTGVQLLARESNIAARSQLPSVLARADLNGSRLRTYLECEVQASFAGWPCGYERKA